MRRPSKTYPCGNCGELIYRAQALRQAGYCDRCEFMTQVEVQWMTRHTRNTLLAMESRGELVAVRIGRTVLYHRADVEQTKARRAGRRDGLSLQERLAA